jgi:hypothetical protein
LLIDWCWWYMVNGDVCRCWLILMIAWWWMHLLTAADSCWLLLLMGADYGWR